VKTDREAPIRQLRWESHRNIAADDAWHHLKGPLFTPDHEIWSHLNENDVLAVEAVAQHPCWSNIVSNGCVRLWERFDPTMFG
jgi:hypothetical protein